jgi:DNA-binding MarR family transcriptional regulator
MAVKRAAEAVPMPAAASDIKTLYLEALTLVERLHRRLLDVIKDEFDREGRSDVNAVQALLIFNIGKSELTPGELRSRGYYLGSNVSYNLKKLLETGHIHHQRSRLDRRSVRISLTEKGHDVARIVNDLYDGHVASIIQAGTMNPSDFRELNNALQWLERFWSEQIVYRP